MKDLARSQGVNSLWQGVITDSKALQQALFLSPSPTESVLVWKQSENGSWIPEVSRDPETLVIGKPNIKPIIKLNPRLKYDHLSTPKTMVEIKVDYATQDCSQWRRSYLTQPPCTELRFQQYGDRDLSEASLNQHNRYINEDCVDIGGGATVRGHFPFKLTAPDGVTLGMIDDALPKVWRRFKGKVTLHCELVGYVDAESPYVSGKRIPW